MLHPQNLLPSFFFSLHYIGEKKKDLKLVNVSLQWLEFYLREKKKDWLEKVLFISGLQRAKWLIDQHLICIL